MNTKELKELKTAINSVCKPEHDLYIDGESFSCRWAADGKFLWTGPSGAKYWMTKNDVLKYIGNGERVKYFSYDYVE